MLSERQGERLQKVHLHCTASEKEQLKALAARDHRSVSGYARKILLDHFDATAS
jgi:hypothetical protein